MQLFKLILFMSDYDHSICYKLLALVDDLQTHEHYYPIEPQITMNGNPFVLSSLWYLLLERLN